MLRASKTIFCIQLVLNTWRKVYRDEEIWAPLKSVMTAHTTVCQLVHVIVNLKARNKAPVTLFVISATYVDSRRRSSHDKANFNLFICFHRSFPLVLKMCLTHARKDKNEKFTTSSLARLIALSCAITSHTPFSPSDLAFIRFV